MKALQVILSNAKKHAKSLTVGSALAVPVLLAVSAPASAAIPTEATAMFTGLATDATAGVALGWPLMAIVTGGFILYRIVRRAANTGAK